MSTQNTLEVSFAGLVNDLKSTVEKEISESTSKEIINQIVNDSLEATIEKVVERKLREMLEQGNFPKKSISHQCIEFNGYQISGDQIKGGIIEKFGSTGIEDRATFVQLTLMDHASVFENPLFATQLDIQGNAKVAGTLQVNGELELNEQAHNKFVSDTADVVKKSMNEDLFNGFAASINNSILTHGIDLDKITQNGKEVLKGNRLGFHITDSNLQKLGLVKDLQTQGETLLSGSFYVTQKRAGVNTMDPSAAFVVWDEECEVTVSKRKLDTAFVGTTRHQKLILGSNKKENIILEEDGSVRVESLQIGNTNIKTGKDIPNYQGQIGHIVLSERPDLTKCLGWVCLGTNRWAKFGEIS